MFTVCEVHCSICRQGFDWHKRYGREACCCSRECWQEFDWRRTLSICGKVYEPDPKRIQAAKAIIEGQQGG